MSATIQIVLVICIAVVLVVDVLNIRKNGQLQQHIDVCTDLHKQLLALLVEQEDVISAELDVLCEDLWNNKVDKLAMQFTEMSKEEDVNYCPFHGQMIYAYREWQNEMSARIKHIKRKQANMTNKMKSILDVNYNKE